VDPPPEVLTIRHVAALARLPLSPIRPLQPLVVRVLQQLTVQGVAIGLKLVTALAELGTLEGGGADRATMREFRGRA
jgi:hypothetical protein